MNIKSKKGFTLIELIVVIAVIGILVLLAMPKFLGYTEKSKVTVIRHDIKVAEGKMTEMLMHGDEVFINEDGNNNEDWDEDYVNEDNLVQLIEDGKLFETKGLVDKEILDLDEDEYVDLSIFKIIPHSMRVDIGTNLPGDFYANAGGKVYYEREKGTTVSNGNSENEVEFAGLIFEYTYDDDTMEATVIGFTDEYKQVAPTGNNKGTVKIPETTEHNGDDYTVAIIGHRAFWWSVDLDDLQATQIFAVEIPNTIHTIESEAFYQNALKSLAIPNSVTFIDDKAFDSNQIATLNIGTGLREIGWKVFSKNKLTKITIPDNIIEICGDAFSENELYEVRIGKNLEEITQGAFSGNDNLQNYIIDGTNQHFSSEGGTLYNKDKSILITGTGSTVINKNVKEIADYAFNNLWLTSIEIPEGVEVIGEWAFAKNRLTELVLPNSIITVKYAAFNANRLESVVFGTNLQTIEDSAFGGTGNIITSITIPANVNLVSYSIKPNFFNKYKGSKLAGTYTAPGHNGTWTLQ